MFKKSLVWLLLVLMVLLMALPITAFANEAPEAAEGSEETPHQHTLKIINNYNNGKPMSYCTTCTYVQTQIGTASFVSMSTSNITAITDESDAIVGYSYTESGITTTLGKGTSTADLTNHKPDGATTKKNFSVAKNNTVTISYPTASFNYVALQIGSKIISHTALANATDRFAGSKTVSLIDTATPSVGRTLVVIELNEMVNEYTFTAPKGISLRNLYIGTSDDLGVDHPVHTYSESEVVSPTCIRNGYTLSTCACGKTTTSDEVENLGGHKWTVGDCSHASVCEVCGTIGAYNHEWVADTVADNGASYYCENCASYKSNPGVYINNSSGKVVEENGTVVMYYFENTNGTIRFEAHPSAGGTYPDLNKNAVRMYNGTIGVISVAEGSFTEIMLSFPGDLEGEQDSAHPGNRGALWAYNQVQNGTFADHLVDVDYATITTSIYRNKDGKAEATRVHIVLDEPVSELKFKSGNDCWYNSYVEVGNVMDVAGEHTHDFKPVKAANCTEIVATDFVCEGCGFGYAGELAPVGHTPGAAADCENDQTCTVCGEVLATKLGHNPGAAADCENDQTCTVCGEVLATKLGHNPGAAADCENDQTCTVCGEVLATKLGHTPGAAADCENDQVCTVCGEVLATKLGHTPGAAADCENDQVCTVCGEVLATKLGHNPGAAADCENDQTCTVCGEVLATKLGHTPGAAADCENDQTCTVCGEVLATKLGHTPGAAADCENDQTCTVCGEVLATKLGHNYGADECCTVCGAANPDAAFAAEVNGKKYLDFAAAYAAAEAGDTVILLADINATEIILINKAITLDGNGKTINSTAARAINVEVNGNVTIKNVTINAAERAINIINKPANVTVENVIATANNNAIMLATSAAGANLTVNASTLTGLAVINVASAGSEVVINNTAITNVDANESESYGAITVWTSAAGANVTVNGGSITVADDSKAAYVFPGDATITLDSDAEIGYIVATVGDAGFETLAGAIAAAKAGQTVKLVRNVTLDATLKVAKNVTIDLAGKTISGTCNASQSSLVFIDNGAKLTVKDSVGRGKMTFAQGTSNVGWTVDVKGEFVLESGIIELTGSWSIGYAVDVRPNSWGTAYTMPTVFTMNGGSIVSSDGGVRVASSSASAHKNVSATFVMNGGLIDAAWDGVFIQQSDAVYDDLSFVMNGGTIESDLNPVRVYGPAPTGYVNDSSCMNITLAGGTMTYTGTETRVWVIEGILRVGGGNSLEIILANGDLAVSSAIAESVTAPEGYEWVTTADGSHTLAERRTYVADVNGTKYDSLADAFAAAKDGATVTLLADIELSESINIPAGAVITLDLAGYTIAGIDTTTKSFGLINNRGTLTVKDSSIGGGKITLEATNDNGWSRYSSVISNNPGGKLIVESGIIEHLGGTSMSYAIDNLTNGKGTYAEVVINGGTINSAYIAIRQFLNGVEATNKLTINDGIVNGANSSIYFQDPSANANSGSLTIAAGATINKRIYLGITAGSTEWPVEISIAAEALAEGVEIVDNGIPAGYEFVLVDGVYVANKKERVEIKYTNVTLNSDFMMSFAFAADSVVDWNGYYVVITKTSANDGSEIEVVIPTSKWTTANIGGAQYLVVDFAGVAAKELADTLTIVVYNADGEAVSDKKVDSIKGYCMRTLEDSTTDEKLATLVVDILNYGAEAQIFFNYATDKLANADLTDEQKAFASSAREYSAESYSKVYADGYRFTAGHTLSLEYNVQLKVGMDIRTLDLSDDAKIVISYVNYEGNKIVKTVNLADTNYKTNILYVTCDTLTARDAAAQVKFELIDGDDVIFTFANSVESFTARTGADSADSNLCAALMKYCDSAAAYFVK